MWRNTRITYIHGFAGPTKPSQKTFPLPPLAPTDADDVSSWNLQFACSLCSYRVHEDQRSNNVEVRHHRKKLVIVVVV
jgi:hypothetical protein